MSCVLHEVLYCATTALDGYPSHWDKIQYIQMETYFYMQHCLLLTMAVITLILITPPIHLSS